MQLAESRDADTWPTLFRHGSASLRRPSRAKIHDETRTRLGESFFLEGTAVIAPRTTTVDPLDNTVRRGRLDLGAPNSGLGGGEGHATTPDSQCSSRSTKGGAILLCICAGTNPRANAQAHRDPGHSKQVHPLRDSNPQSSD